jgi:soluble lytic murein transglycosylase
MVPRVAIVSLCLLSAAPVAAAPALKLASLTPYFSAGAAASAARSLRLEEYAQAAQGFAEYQRKKPHAPDARQATFARAYAEMKAGQSLAAATRFDGLTGDYPLLVDYERLYAARAYLAADKAVEAADRAKLVPPTSALDGEARLLRAECAGRAGDAEQAASEYRGYLEAYPQSWRASEARYRLAEALSQGGHRDDANAELRRVYLEAPSESWGRQAEARLKVEGPQRYDAPDLARRATALFDAMRNTESEAEWRRVLTAPKLTDALACVAQFNIAQSVFKQRDRQRAASLFETAVAACEKAKDEDLATKALYQAGRSFASRGDKDPVSTRHGIDLFERAWREHAAHSYADDARLREAEALDTLKDPDRATELLSGLPEAFKTGDQRGEALWRLAFRAWRKGDLVEAARRLSTELELLPREDGWWEAGRTLYWLGRIADRNGAGDQARAFYRRAFVEYPLSYYALQAGNRLRDKWPDVAAALFAEVSKEADDAGGWVFPDRELFHTPGFLRAVELARLGLGPEAKRELQLLGIQPARRGVKLKPEEEELQWLAAVLYDQAGEYALSHAIPRHLLPGYERAFPVGANHRRWLLSYPRAYAELIERHAQLNGQPAALELAIVREESAFDPLMESFANAVGLTQLTAAPAARFAQGLPHDRVALHDPAINITIGARELGQLWNAFERNAGLAIAGYNAGEGAVRRWLADPERADVMALDEFIEAIPYDETRGYTKRVLASFFAYRWLEGGPPIDRVPVLPLQRPGGKHR